MIDELISTQGELKILGFLLKNSKNIYNMTEIMEGSQIHYETAKYSIKQLLSKDLIEKVTKSHKSFLFRLNSKHGLIQALLFYFENEHLNRKKIIN